MGLVVIRVAKEFDVVHFYISKAGTERLEQLQKANRCCSCEQPFDGQKVVKHCVGQCKTCYNATRRAIREGRESQEGLIRDGYMLPPHQGNVGANEFTQRIGRRSKRKVKSKK